MPSLPIPINTAKKEHPVIDKCSFLARAQVWPHISTINPRQWIKNFRGSDELYIAHELLDSFMYFSPLMSRELLRSAVQKIIPRLAPFTTPQSISLKWKEAIDNLYVVAVSGENPNPTDSGLGYSRLVRDMFGIPQERFIPHRKLVLDLLSGEIGPDSIILFVDDFVGSGNQFITLWDYPVPLSPDLSLSIKDVAQTNPVKFFYCPLIATSYGLEVISSSCQGDVIVSPAYVLTDEYDALSPRSRIWKTQRARDMASDVLSGIAHRVGMPDTNGRSTKDWRGFHKLGLGLAIRDSIPDACLGVFHFAENNWKPLFNKAG